MHDNDEFNSIYYWYDYKLFDVINKIDINIIEIKQLIRAGIRVTYRHHCARSLVCLRENERERVTKKTRGRERGQERQERDSGVPVQRTKRERYWLGECAVGRGCSLAGKGIEFRATGERGRPRARGVEADAHRVPAVNVDYARALNLCACIRERTLGLGLS